MTKIIVSDHITLDIISEQDISRLQELADHEIMHKHIGDDFPYPYTIEDAQWWVNNVKEKIKTPKKSGEVYDQYAIYINNEYAGGIGRETKELGRKAHNFHLGYWIAQEYRGKGYMSTLVGFLSGYILEQYIPCDRIYAYVYSFNPGSRKVLEKNGFTLEGTLRKSIKWKGEAYDTWVFGLLRNEL